MNGLIVFAKAPIEGEVKTRLAATVPLSPAEVCALYAAFLEDILITAAASCADTIFLNFTPASEEARMRELALRHIAPQRLAMRPQEGESFVDRIRASFAAAEAMGATRMAMIGSDFPQLQPRVIDKAFALLEKHGAVAGPSGGGGIYLIGLRAGIVPDWEAVFGEGAEFANFCREAARLGAPPPVLEEVTDVDVASDLVTLLALLEGMACSADMPHPHGMAGLNAMADMGEKAEQQRFPRRTFAALKKLGLTVVRNGGTRDKTVERHG